MLGIFNNIKNGHNVDIPDMKPKENNLKYDKLLKEHELLKGKFEVAVKELSEEREKKKVQPTVKVEDTKNTDLQNGKPYNFKITQKEDNKMYVISILCYSKEKVRGSACFTGS